MATAGPVFPSGNFDIHSRTGRVAAFWSPVKTVCGRGEELAAIFSRASSKLRLQAGWFQLFRDHPLSL